MSARRSWIVWPLIPDAAGSFLAAAVFARCGLLLARAARAAVRELFICFSGETLPVFVLTVFAKNEKANLSQTERDALAKMVIDMIKSYRRQK